MQRKGMSEAINLMKSEREPKRIPISLDFLSRMNCVGILL